MIDIDFFKELAYKKIKITKSKDNIRSEVKMLFLTCLVIILYGNNLFWVLRIES